MSLSQGAKDLKPVPGHRSALRTYGQLRCRFAGRALLCSAALGVALGVPPLGTAGATQQSDEAVCEAGKTLIDEALPQQARKLVIANLDPPFTNDCLKDTRTAAATAIAKAETIASEASAEISTNPADARVKVEAALDVDAENATALKLKSSLAEPSRSETFTLRWEKLVNSLKPHRDVALAFLVVFLVLLILARFASALPHDWPKSGDADRTFFWVGGLIAAVASSLLLTFGLAAIDRSPAFGRWLLIPAMGAALGALAVFWLTKAMAMRLRLIIEVRDTKGAVSEVSTGQVIALLGELGAAPPRGLEVPRGSDVTALEGTPIAGTPEGKIVAALTRIWQLITGLTPWRVRVDEETDDLHSIVITRNGHPITSVVVDRDLLGLRSAIVEEADAGGKAPANTADATDEKKGGATDKTPRLPDLHRFAAAAILTTLARHYDGFEGLCGVTDWRSLGLHYIATTDYASEANANQGRAALARALDFDPSNIPARVALRHSQDRKSVDSGVLGEYIKWLLKTSNDGELASDHVYALRLRIRMSLIAAACNRQALDDATPLEAPTVADLVKAGDDLISALNSGDPRGRAGALVRAMQPSAAAAFLSLAGTKHRDTVDPCVKWLKHVHRFSPRGHYNYACFQAREHPSLADPEGAREPPDFMAAVEHLRLASAEPNLRASMTADPWLSLLREKDEYKKEFLQTPRDDLLSLEPLSNYGDDLRKAGLDTAERVAAMSNWRLSRYLKIDLLVAERLINIANLASDIPQHLSEFQVEIIQALLDEGIDSRAGLDARLDVPGGGKGLAKKLHEAIDDRCKKAPSDDQLGKKWLDPKPTR
jgi:hypothetical protein